MAKTKAKAGYSAKDITVLEGLEPVRLRPGMYIGTTGPRGLHHLVEEIVANSVDEALAGHNDSIEVTIHPDNSVTVRDRGRGIPVDKMEDTGPLGARGDHDQAARRREVRRRRLQGLRRPARRRRLRRERALRVARRRGRARRERLPPGVRRAACPAGAMQVVGRVEGDRHDDTFLADAEIFEETDYDATTLLSRFREMAFLTRGLRISFTDERADGGKPVEFHYEGGIKDFVSYINESKDIAHQHVVYFSSAAPTRARSRSRCSGTPRTRSRCSRSPTTSTRTRAARTCRASAPRSRRRSTSTRATRRC